MSLEQNEWETFLCSTTIINWDKYLLQTVYMIVSWLYVMNKKNKTWLTKEAFPNMNNKFEWKDFYFLPFFIKMKILLQKENKNSLQSINTFWMFTIFKELYREYRLPSKLPAEVWQENKSTPMKMFFTFNFN